MGRRAPYVNDRTYLVYAERDPNGELHDGICTSSRPVEFAGDDLQYLRRYFAGKTKGTIRGRVAASRDTSSLDFALEHGYAKTVDGARIVVRKGVQRWELKSDADGSYEITGLQAGEYSVSARHDDYEAGWAGDSIQVSSRGCSIQNIGLRAKNSVEGRVVDSEGLPVEKIEVRLLSADPKMANVRYSEWADHSGRFIFRWITPGTYRLAVNPDGISPRSPYPPSFYNNAADPELAEKLTIGPQTELSWLNLVLGKKQLTRRIAVQIYWPDRSPVANATIRCAPLGEEDSGQSELGATDQNGEAACEVLADRAYRVRLARLGYNGDPEPREATVAAGEAVARTTLIPSQRDFERRTASPKPSR